MPVEGVWTGLGIFLAHASWCLACGLFRGWASAQDELQSGEGRYPDALVGVVCVHYFVLWVVTLWSEDDPPAILHVCSMVVLAAFGLATNVVVALGVCVAFGTAVLFVMTLMLCSRTREETDVSNRLLSTDNPVVLPDAAGVDMAHFTPPGDDGYANPARGGRVKVGLFEGGEGRQGVQNGGDLGDGARLASDGGADGRRARGQRHARASDISAAP
jgi:hypothetical protein